LTVLIAEQNARVTLKNADYGYILQEGAIAQHGTSEALRQDESVQAAYLGLEV
jgi:branched-chain amino acid transport system ATP-binding protein